MCKIVYGTDIANRIKKKVKETIDKSLKEGKRAPHLSVILVGNNDASRIYVKGKKRDCDEVGINMSILHFDNISEKELIHQIEMLNNDDEVDGILVQLPLPEYINEDNIINAISPAKDVDGFHPYNAGKLFIGEDTFIPCTPKGIIRVLEEIGLHDLSGKKAVVIGRSNIVGKPVAKLLMDKNATVMICHSKTANIKEETRQADILVSAIGKSQIIKRDWIKNETIVIDVGINRNENGKVCGDVDFEDVIDKVSYITPVPKGIGLMTRAMLLENVIQAYQRQQSSNF